MQSKESSSIHQAIQEIIFKGDIENLQISLQNNQGILKENPFWLAPLNNYLRSQNSSSERAFEILDLLIKSGANINQRNESDETLLNLLIDPTLLIDTNSIEIYEELGNKISESRDSISFLKQRVTAVILPNSAIKSCIDSLDAIVTSLLANSSEDNIPKFTLSQQILLPSQLAKDFKILIFLYEQLITFLTEINRHSNEQKKKVNYTQLPLFISKLLENNPTIVQSMKGKENLLHHLVNTYISNIGKFWEDETDWEWFEPNMSFIPKIFALLITKGHFSLKTRDKNGNTALEIFFNAFHWSNSDDFFLTNDFFKTLKFHLEENNKNTKNPIIIDNKEFVSDEILNAWFGNTSKKYTCKGDLFKILYYYFPSRSLLIVLPFLFKHLNKIKSYLDCNPKDKIDSELEVIFKCFDSSQNPTETTLPLLIDDPDILSDEYIKNWLSTLGPLPSVSNVLYRFLNTTFILFYRYFPTRFYLLANHLISSGEDIHIPDKLKRQFGFELEMPTQNNIDLATIDSNQLDTTLTELLEKIEVCSRWILRFSDESRDNSYLAKKKEEFTTLINLAIRHLDRISKLEKNNERETEKNQIDLRQKNKKDFVSRLKKIIEWLLENRIETFDETAMSSLKKLENRLHTILYPEDTPKALRQLALEYIFREGLQIECENDQEIEFQQIRISGLSSLPQRNDEQDKKALLKRLFIATLNQNIEAPLEENGEIEGYCVGIDPSK